jgi:hypothetical protein
MPDLKYLYRALYMYILINCFFKQIVDIFFFSKDYYQESYILIIEYSSVVTIAEWLDGSALKRPVVVRYPKVPKYVYHVFMLKTVKSWFLLNNLIFP